MLQEFLLKFLRQLFQLLQLLLLQPLLPLVLLQQPVRFQLQLLLQLLLSWLFQHLKLLSYLNLSQIINRPFQPEFSHPYLLTKLQIQHLLVLELKLLQQYHRLSDFCKEHLCKKVLLLQYRQVLRQYLPKKQLFRNLIRQLQGWYLDCINLIFQ